MRTREVATAVLLGGLLALPPAGARAEGRRALLVGVSHYSAEAHRRPRGWQDLRGPQNDVAALRDVLVARYGFRPEDVVLLQDEAATRDAILAAFRRVLLAGAAPGDVGVLYFAGHGSWVRNTLSPDPARQDETIVPSDGLDIRDKEIARLLAEAGRARVRITAIFDSCHSGSVARGLAPTGALRALPPDEEMDARDPRPAPTPAQSGALVVAAARADQSAHEIVDDDGRAHGAFTAALLTVLRTAPAETDAEAVLLRVRALVAASGVAQEPVLDGPPERMRAPLFGPARTGRSRTLVAAAGQARDGAVELLAGAAIGLAPGTALVRTSGPRVRLSVEEVLGLSRATARGASEADRKVAIAPGDLFEVERWTAPARAALRVHLGETLPAGEVRTAIRGLGALRDSAAIHWVADPTRIAPTHVLHWSRGSWALRLPGGDEVALGPSPATEELVSRLARSGGVRGRAHPCDARPCLFVRAPVATELAAALASETSEDGVARPVASEGEATYLLAGRIGSSGAAEYAWMLADAPAQPERAEPLPRRSEWHAAPDPVQAARDLDGDAARIARIRAWLTLEPPPQEDRFPYRLAIRRQGEREPLAPGAVLHAGVVYEPLLVARPEDLAAGSPIRHVYVLVIDSAGRISVLYPSDRVSVDNRFPLARPGAQLPAQIPLGERGLFRVGEPFGTDTYLLLSTSEAIPAPSRLEQEGVMRGERPGGGDPLLDLLTSAGRRRGAGAPVPSGWSLDRLTAVSAR
jgi:hypothetical protein